MSSLHRSGWVSLVSISLGGQYLFRFEISKPANEFDIHRPQALRPAYFFYRPSLRWDWSCFVEDSGLRGEQRTLPHLGCSMLTLVFVFWNISDCHVLSHNGELKLKSARKGRYSKDPSVPWCILYPKMWCFLEPQNPNNHVVKCIPKHLSILLGATHLTLCASS